MTKDVEEFNDAIYNMINTLFSEADEHDDVVNQIYTKVAQCFTFNYDNIHNDSNDFTREWVCSNCGSFNFCKHIGGQLNNMLSNCTLCGITQTDYVMLQIRNYDRYTMHMDSKNEATIGDVKENKQDEMDDTINQVINANHINIKCPNRNDKQKCPAMI
eukprot:345224_1